MSLFAKKEDKSFNLRTPVDYDFDTYLLESLYLLDDKFYETHYENVRNIHIGKLDSSMEILEESFTDFMKSIIDFLKALIEKLKTYFGKVFMYISSLIGNFSKFIKNNKDKLSINRNYEINTTGYIFTTNKNINFSILESLVSSYNDDLRKITNNEIKASDIKERRNKFNSENYQDELRGKILGVSPIEKEDYLEETKAIFRDGETEPKEIKFTHADVMDIVNKYSSVDKTFKDCKKEQVKMIALTNDLKTFFEKSYSTYFKNKDKKISVSNIEKKDYSIKKTDTNYIDYSDGNIKLINSYFSFKSLECKEISNMTLIALNSKVMALKDELSFYRDIVRKSIFKKEGDI